MVPRSSSLPSPEMYSACQKRRGVCSSRREIQSGRGGDDRTREPAVKINFVRTSLTLPPLLTIEVSRTA
jgi:hypothetical protein